MAAIIISRSPAGLRGAKLRRLPLHASATPNEVRDHSNKTVTIARVGRPTTSVFRAVPVTSAIAPQVRALSHAARAQEFLQHGRLADDHPAVALARNSLARLKNLPRTYTLDVIAHALDFDAHIYPDGGIVISLKLLEFLKTEEALCGILRHEIQHDRSGDFNRGEIKADDATLESMVVKELKEKSRSRIGEVRADLEGAIKALATIDGINPKGYIELLEDLDAKERLRKQDLRGGTHGNSGDRALAARFLTHLVDLPALNQPLTPIAGKEKWRQGLPSHPFELFGTISILVKYAPDPKEAAKEIQKRRMQYFNDLNPVERLSFLNLLSERWSPAMSDAKASEYPHAKLFWDNCIKRCETDLSTLGLCVPEADGLIFIRRFVVAALVPQDEGAQVLNPVFDSPEHLTNLLQMLTTLNWPFHFLHAEGFLKTWLPQYLAQAALTNAAADLDGVIDALVALVASGAHPVDVAQLRQIVLIIIDTKAAMLAEPLRSHWQIDQPEPALITTKGTAGEAGQSGSQEKPPQEEHKSEFWEVLKETKAYQKMQALMVDVEKSGFSKLSPKIFLRELFEAARTLEAEKIAGFLHSILDNYFVRIDASGKKLKNLMDVNKVIGTRLGEVMQQALVDYTKLLQEHDEFKSLKDFQRAHLINLLANSLGFVEESYRQEITLEQGKLRFPTEYLPKELRVNSDGFTDIETKLYGRADDMSLDDIIWLFKQSVATPFGSEKKQQVAMPERVKRVIFRRLATLANQPKSFWAVYEILTVAGMDIPKLVKDHQEQATGFMRALAAHIEKHQKQGKLLDALHMLSDGVRDPFLARQLTAYELECFWKENSSFITRAAHFLDEKNGAHFEYQDRLIEVATTNEDFAILHERLRKRLSALAEEGSRLIGGTMASELLNPIGKTAIEQICLLMRTRRSDTELKTVLAQHWENSENINLNDERLNSSRNRDRAIRENIEVEDRHLLEQVHASDRIINALLALPKEACIYLVKRLLVDSNLIREPKGRQEVLELLLKEAIEADEHDPIYQGLAAAVRA